MTDNRDISNVSVTYKGGGCINLFYFNNPILFIISAFFLVYIFPNSKAFANKKNNISLLRSNLISEFRAYSYVEKADDISRKMLLDGSFRDIDYYSRNIANWGPLIHLDRLLILAQNYNDPLSKDHSSNLLADKINMGLIFWYKKKPRSDNWWHNDIGQQLRLGPILVLMHPSLPSNTVYSGLRYLKDPTEIPTKMTGQNLIWFASQGIYRGVVSDNGADIDKNVNIIGSEIKVSLDEGIQQDLSFHQHGPLLYSGGYGFAFVRDIIQWIGVLDGSGFQLSGYKIDLIANVLLEGLRWMVRGPNIDPSVGGREISRQDYALRDPTITKMCQILSQIIPSRRSAFLDFVAEIESPDAPQSLAGSKAFFRSDYLVQRSPKHFYSLRMFSKRTIGTEMINNENIKGFWLPFGLTTIQKSGSEYQDIYPVWNWSRLPGVTSPQTDPITTKTVTSDVEQVNVLAHEGFAVGTMVYPQSSVTAHKSWFFFDQDMVALGDGISSNKNYQVFTSLDQSLAPTQNAFIDGDSVGQSTWTKSVKQWVWYENTAYVLLSPLKANAQVQTQKGSWKGINLQYPDYLIEKNVFSMWIDHGIRPQDAQYAYLVINGMPLKEAIEYIKINPVKILSNSLTAQVAFHSPSQTTGIVFRQPGNIRLESGYTLSVSRPCVALVHESSYKQWITIAPIDGYPYSIVVKAVSADGISGQWTAHFSPDSGQEKLSTHPWPIL